MKVILQKDVPNLGDAGEIKMVADGYARNYLIPRKLVVPAVGGSTKALAHQKMMMEAKAAKRLSEMQEVAKNLESIGSVDIVVRVGAKNKLFGSVTAMNIAQALTDQGFPVEKRRVELQDNIKSLGKFPVKVRLAEKLVVPVTVNVVPDEESLQQVEEEEAVRRAAEERAKEAQARAEGKVIEKEQPEEQAEAPSEEAAAEEVAGETVVAEDSAGES
jgi:large subunit ribosomal protein L9